MGQGRSSLGTLRLQLKSSLPKSLSKLTTRDQNDRNKYAASSMQGLRLYMEDARAVILDLDGTRSTSFFGVYDGYRGANVAQYCANRFRTELLKEEDWRALAKPHHFDFLSCLKTAVCVQAMDLSTDHKPSLSDDSQRIENSGGRVTRDALNFRCLGQARMLLGGYCVNEMSPMSRAIGDFYFNWNRDLPRTGKMVICDPHIRTANITELLLIASDGIWDIMSSQHPADFVHKKSENKLANANDVGLTRSRNENYAPSTPRMKKQATASSWSANGQLGSRRFFSTKVKYIASSEPSPENTVVVCLDGSFEDFRESYMGGLGEICELCYNNGKRVNISKICDGHPEMITTPSSGYFWLKLVYGKRYLLFPIIAKNLYLLGWKGGKGGAFVTKDNDDMEGYNLLEQAKALSFSESYCDMVGDLAAVRIGPHAMRDAFETLYRFRGHGHQSAARALRIIAVNFSEAARLRRVSRSVCASFSDFSVTVLDDRKEENSKWVHDYGSSCKNSMKDIDTCLTKQQHVNESTSEALSQIRIFLEVDTIKEYLSMKIQKLHDPNLQDSEAKHLHLYWMTGFPVKSWGRGRIQIRNAASWHVLFGEIVMAQKIVHERFWGGLRCKFCSKRSSRSSVHTIPS